MATKNCLFCKKLITDKSYRSMSSTTSKEHYKEVYTQLGVPAVDGFACNICVNKLNKVVKLNNDMRTKYFVIKDERDKLLSLLKAMPGLKHVTQIASFKTPSPRGFKRSLVKNTPTPTSKKSLFSSPKLDRIRSPIKFSAEKTQKKVDMSTQTKTTTEEFDVKVCKIKHVRFLSIHFTYM